MAGKRGYRLVGHLALVGSRQVMTVAKFAKVYAGIHSRITSKQ